MEQKLSDILQGKQTIALSGHVRPDGDCVGSTMGLYLYLKEYNPSIQVDVYLEEIPQPYQMIQGVEVIRHEIPKEMQYDLFICLDCGDEKRLGFSAPLFQQAKDTFCIDHHVSNEAFANHNYIVPDASSTSELVFRLLDADRITKPIAEALYMGISHDTGVFQYPCTSPETMEAAAILMRKGISHSEIIEKTYYEKTYIQLQILAKALLESTMLPDEESVLSVIDRAMMLQYGLEPYDLEGIVSELRNIKGVEVAIFMYEQKTHQFKVSLRSKQKVDVSVIAKHFGGGGHKRAAGFSIFGTSDHIVPMIREQIRLQLDTGNETI